MIHPTHSDLVAFVDRALVDSRAADVARHLESCEFCSEYVTEYEAYRRGVSEILGTLPNDETAEDPATTPRRGPRNAVVELKLLSTMRALPDSHLAADGQQEPHYDIISLATLYSESPEIVMKLMRNQRDGTNFLQLIAEAPELTANVLVCSPEQGTEIMTDEGGRAVLPEALTADPSVLHWQIRLPEATFALEPLVYDPNRTEYSGDVVLETDRGDRVRVTLVGKTVGKQIEVELLALDGNSDFATARIVLVAADESRVQSATSGQRILFALPDKATAVNLRIFQ
jgi:hypothetical protein